MLTTYLSSPRKTTWKNSWIYLCSHFNKGKLDSSSV
uniref:Uncharacterized protein n=1 Tax=Anguilla anguilla TaxID=7936 RepID=A0A0E9W9M9_ANGAN